MKTISVNLKNHFALSLSTIATCWLIVRKDGTALGFTDCSFSFPFTDTFTGVPRTVIYGAATGMTPTSVKAGSDSTVDNLNVVGSLTSASLTEADLSAGLYDGATVMIFEVNYKSLGDGCMIVKGGYLGNVSRHRVSFDAEVRGKIQALQQIFGHLVTPSCNADLGDARCTVGLGPYTFTGTITALSGGSRSVFVDTANVQVDHYFQYGLLTWTGGLNAGLKMEVKDWLVGSHTMTLLQGMPYNFSIGDSYSVYKGCSKILNDATQGCASFANTVNFRGFPYVPGIDKLYQTPNAH